MPQEDAQWWNQAGNMDDLGKDPVPLSEQKFLEHWICASRYVRGLGHGDWVAALKEGVVIRRGRQGDEWLTTNKRSIVEEACRRNSWGSTWPCTFTWEKTSQVGLHVSPEGGQKDKKNTRLKQLHKSVKECDALGDKVWYVLENRAFLWWNLVLCL